jgi:hypothetical protein
MKYIMIQFYRPTKNIHLVPSPFKVIQSFFYFRRMSSYVDNVRKNVVGQGQVQELGGQGPQVGSCFSWLILHQ